MTVETEALEYVVEKVMGIEDNTPIALALAKMSVNDIFALIMFKPDDIEKFTYDRPAEEGKKAQKNQKLSLADIRLLQSVKEYIEYQTVDQGLKLRTMSDWEKLTKAGFDEFRLTIAPTLGASRAPSSYATTAPPPTPAPDALRDWKKGVKRDMTLYTELTKDKNWDVWDTQFRATAVTQGLGNVLDAKYVPVDRTAADLFTEQQKFLYAVFVRTLKTDKGKSIVRKHKDSFDAQKIYKEMVDYASTSTQAILDANRTLMYLVTVRINDGTWNGSSEKFVLHWMEQLRLYETLIDPKDILSDAIKMMLLQSAVRGSVQLGQVYNVALQLATHHNTPVTYQKYTELLLSECAQLDSALVRKNAKSNARSVYSSFIAPDVGEDDALPNFLGADDEDIVYDIDSDPDLLINAHNRREAYRVLMGGEKWTKLSKTGQETWDKLSEEDKAHILGRNLDAKTSPNGKPPSKFKPGLMRRKVNLHDMSAHDFLVASMHEMTTGEDQESSEEQGLGTQDESSSGDPAETLRAFLASRGDSASPADLRNVLSTSSKRQAEKKEVKVNQSVREVNFCKINRVSDRRIVRVEFPDDDMSIDSALQDIMDDIPDLVSIDDIPELLPREDSVHSSSSSSDGLSIESDDDVETVVPSLTPQRRGDDDDSSVESELLWFMDNPSMTVYIDASEDSSWYHEQSAQLERMGFHMNPTTMIWEPIRGYIRSESVPDEISSLGQREWSRELRDFINDVPENREASNHTVYRVSQHHTESKGALVDRGANGGVVGDDVRVVAIADQPPVNVQGISNHQITDLKIVTAAGVVPSQHGEVIAIFHQYAYNGQGKTIHSSLQLEEYGLDVNEKSIKVPGGLQRIKTPDGYTHPLKIKDGLAYITIRPYTDEEWDSLPHVVWTRDDKWNPSVFDHEFDERQDEWYDAVSDLAVQPNRQLFDEFGNYRHREPIVAAEHFREAMEDELTSLREQDAFSDVGDLVDACIAHANSTVEVNERAIKPAERDYESLRKHFGWANADVVKKTFENTTQMGRLSNATHLKKHYQSPNPALNIPRRHEPVATDYVYADVPAIDNGSVGAQIFVGTESDVVDAEGLKSPKQFVNTLEDNIRKRGAMDKLISDRAQVEISNRVLDILRALFISSWQSEPHQQHQNAAERKYQTIKRNVNTVLDRTGAPAYTWLLCLLYVCFILNRLSSEKLGWRSPLEYLTGSTPDISPLLRFHFWEPVYYKVEDGDYPSDSTEGRGRWVGVAENVGHAMTYMILRDDTKKIIYRSNVRSALTDKDRNKRIDFLDGEDVPSILKSFEDEGKETSQEKQMPVFDPTDLVGRTFLMDKQEDGQRFRAKIIEAIEEKNADLADQPERIKFLCSVDNGTYEEVVTYNQLLEYINKNDEEDGENPILWKFRRITSHQGPLSRNDKDYKGSKYNVLVEWETGEVTAEPLDVIAADDPVTCALYAKGAGLLEEPGWRRFKSLAKREKKLLRMVNQAKLSSFRRAPKYKFGFQVPRNHEEAMQFDAKNGNTKWKDAEATELKCLLDYQTFEDLGKGGQPPPGYRKLIMLTVYDVKHDGRHRARMVAGGHLTAVPDESVYSGVVSLRGIRIMTFLAELNQLEIWGADISSAYLEARTKEKLFVKAGPEFGDLEGHTLVVVKSLYGLRTSGVRWHERLSDCLRDMGFFPSKSEPDIWMRRCDDHYEYIGTYVDDLAIVSKNPQAIIKLLELKHKFKLKGVGPITYHLGCDFVRDENGVLCVQPRKYVERMIDTYERFFGSKPTENVSSPLEKGDHPELDTSELLDADGLQKYQSMIGALQWAISIGRIDITTAVMTLSSFRVAPRVGHLQRAKRVYCYLAKMRHAMIRVRTDEPDYSAIPEPVYDWAHSVYGDVKEVIPDDCPIPLGNYVTLSHFVDANLYHDIITGRSVTGTLHLLNKTPIDWYSKKQGTVETATFGSEFSAAKTCVEQVMDLRSTLRYLGVPLRETSYMFGDNKSVVDNASVPQGKLHKRHTMLAYHRVREAIASKMLRFFYIPGELNPADILSKHWGYQQIWKQLQPLMFYPGDTRELFDKKLAIPEKGDS